MAGLVSACQAKLDKADLDIATGLGNIITEVKNAADAGLLVIGIENEATHTFGNEAK